MRLGVVQQRLLQLGMGDRPLDMAAGYIVRPMMGFERFAILISLPDWQWLRSGGRQQGDQTESIRLPRAPRVERFAPNPIAEPCLALDDRDADAGRCQRGTEARPGDSTADNRDIRFQDR